MSSPDIREYDRARDHAAVRSCFIELQDFERGLDPRMPPGEEITDRYLDLMFQRCREFAGVVLVALVAESVVGFVSVWTRYRSSEPDDAPGENGYVSDLVVSAKYRGRGIGRALLRAAEERVRSAGSDTVSLSVKAGNKGALALYSDEGFEPTDLVLEKRLERKTVSTPNTSRTPKRRA